MKKQRKHYTLEEKVAILRRHLLDKEPISQFFDELGLQSMVFYRWQKEFFENGASAFEQKRPANYSSEQEGIAYLEKIQTKDEVLAELMAKHVASKKERLGNSNRSLGPARYAGPAPDEIHDLVPRIMRNPDAGQSSPSVFLARHAPPSIRPDLRPSSGSSSPGSRSVPARRYG